MTKCDERVTNVTLLPGCDDAEVKTTKMKRHLRSRKHRSLNFRLKRFSLVIATSLFCSRCSRCLRSLRSNPETTTTITRATSTATTNFCHRKFDFRVRHRLPEFGPTFFHKNSSMDIYDDDDDDDDGNDDDDNDDDDDRFEFIFAISSVSVFFLGIALSLLT